MPYRDQQQRLTAADEALNVVHLTGDACVNAFFSGSKKKQREDRCKELFQRVSDWYASGHDINRRGPIAAAAAELRSGEHPIPAFHWEIEFPEVFARENGGFDAFIGNPPFCEGAIDGLERVLVVARVSRTLGFTFLPTGGVINDKIIVFPFDSYAAFATFQSRVHETWARTFSSTLKDDLQYTPTDCLDTFPFPARFQSESTLEATGKRFHDARQIQMECEGIGVTQFSHRFHDPHEKSSEIVHLREFHAAEEVRRIAPSPFAGDVVMRRFGVSRESAADSVKSSAADRCGRRFQCWL